jgi:hypothetical protein
MATVPLGHVMQYQTINPATWGRLLLCHHTFTFTPQTREQVDGIAIGDQPAGLAADLIGSAMAAVNWDEIAEHFVEDAIRNEAEQTENANA